MPITTFQFRVKRGFPPSTVPRIPHLALLCVVIGNVSDALKLHVIDHGADGIVLGLEAAVLDGVFIQHHQRPMGGTMASPTQGNEVVRMVCAAASPWLDVVYLQYIRTIAEGTAKAVPSIDLLAGLVADVRAHGVRAFLLHGEAPSFLPPLAALSTQHTSARAGASPFISTLAPCGTMGEREEKKGWMEEKTRTLTISIQQMFDRRNHKKLVTCIGQCTGIPQVSWHPSRERYQSKRMFLERNKAKKGYGGK